MQRWSWQHSSGATRSAGLVSVLSVTTRGILLPSIAGIAYVDALKAVDRNHEGLMKISGVQSLVPSEDGLIIYTTVPAKLPPHVEGVPVIAEVVQNS